MNTCMVGWAHTPFGRLEGETVESLIVRVATDALIDAGAYISDFLRRKSNSRVSNAILNKRAG